MDDVVLFILFKIFVLEGVVAENDAMRSHAVSQLEV